MLHLLRGTDSVYNLVHLAGAAEKPKGDLILCDIAREDVSVIIEDLRELDVPTEGSIAIERIDSELSEAAKRAERAAAGRPGDAVIWEEVETKTSENIEASASFFIFMVLSTLLASVAILLDSPILMVGAMVVGPEFGPLAGLCVAAVQRRMDVARRSLLALVLGFPLAIAAAYAFALVIKTAELTPDAFSSDDHPLTQFISHPDTFSVIVAVLAGIVGVLSLTSTKSSALIGVLVSVTTIPAAANIGLAAAYQDWGEWRGAMAQLALNLTGIVIAGIVTLYIQRRLYQRRRVKRLEHESRERAGLPKGSSRRADAADGI